MSVRLFRTTPLAAALFAGLYAASGAQAAPVVVSATTSAFDSTNTPGSTTPSASPGYANSSSSAGDTFGNAYSYAFSADSGAYAVSSNAEGIARSAAEATFSQEITNAGTTAQQYFLTLKIYGGFMSADVYDPAGLLGTESLLSSYLASVKVNGNSVFFSTATVQRTGNTGSCTRSGVVLSGASACAATDTSYGWGTDFYTIDLGILQAGESLDLLADLEGSSVANVGVYDFGGGGGGYGYGCFEPQSTAANVQTLAAVSECATFKGRASQFYGDPSELDQPGLNIRSTAVNVPLPATSLLALLGLGAVGWTGRRRRRGDMLTPQVPPASGTGR